MCVGKSVGIFLCVLCCGHHLPDIHVLNCRMSVHDDSPVRLEGRLTPRSSHNLANTDSPLEVGEYDSTYATPPRVQSLNVITTRTTIIPDRLSVEQLDDVICTVGIFSTVSDLLRLIVLPTFQRRVRFSFKLYIRQGWTFTKLNLCTLGTATFLWLLF